MMSAPVTPPYGKGSATKFIDRVDIVPSVDRARTSRDRAHCTPHDHPLIFVGVEREPSRPREAALDGNHGQSKHMDRDDSDGASTLKVKIATRTWTAAYF